jgi:hypothetical protein
MTRERAIVLLNESMNALLRLANRPDVSDELRRQASEQRDAIAFALEAIIRMEAVESIADAVTRPCHECGHGVERHGTLGCNLCGCRQGE